MASYVCFFTTANGKMKFLSKFQAPYKLKFLALLGHSGGFDAVYNQDKFVYRAFRRARDL